MSDQRSADPVSINGTDYREECVGVTKMRDMNERGDAVRDSWCYIHHHWLNAKGVKSVMDKMIEDWRR